MKWGKAILVIFGAMIITALGIDAADTITGSEGTLLSQVISNDEGGCPQGMSPVGNGTTISCIDTYEVSTGSNCPVRDPENLVSSLTNIEASGCQAESKPDALPWRFVTRDQAMQLCARANKRLPTSEEWYMLSLGMVNVEDSCNIDSKEVSKTGEYASCVNPQGAHDLVGNVWEWVSDDVIDGTYNERKLPGEGYVAQVDNAGMAMMTSNDQQQLFGGDYFWSKDEGAYGVIRGGYYDSGRDAGIYTAHADTLPTAASVGIGFRCVK